MTGGDGGGFINDGLEPDLECILLTSRNGRDQVTLNSFAVADQQPIISVTVHLSSIDVTPLLLT